MRSTRRCAITGVATSVRTSAANSFCMMLLRLSKKRSACGIPPRQTPLANHMKHLRTLLPIFLLAASATFAQDNTTTQFGEKITVNTVLIDAVVTDRSGNQMLGLSKDDF